ncbi:hypothetical protein ACFKKJ_10250, partial [Streptococcus agalactiae]|uniref:hypothetical protein n=1 Tax=Streptococcus agalactiae TaxID=1311 RepID=UPI0036410B80
DNSEAAIVDVNSTFLFIFIASIPISFLLVRDYNITLYWTIKLFSDGLKKLYLVSNKTVI